MSIKKTYIPAKPRSSKLVGTSMSGGVAGSVSSSSADPNAHSHSNKVVLDKLTDGDIDVLRKLSLDEGGNIKVDTTLWATGGISALGLGEGGEPGTGGDFDRLDAWVDYNETKANWVLSALLGYDLHTRVNDLEAGGGSSNIEISITGSGNAITGVSLSENTLTFAKGSSFSLSNHNHNTLYKPIGYVPSWGEITGKPSTFAPSAHTHNTLYKPIGYVPSWGEITGKPSTFAPSAHTHNTLYKPIGYVPSWGEITGKPSTFAPSAHTHNTLYKPIGYVPSWGEITGKPSTFAPSAHIHSITDITGLQGALNSKLNLTGGTLSGELNISTNTFNNYLLRIQSATSNVAGRFNGIGFSGDPLNTKGAILFESLGSSYSRGKLIFALNNELNQNMATPVDAIMTLLPTGNVGIGTTNPLYKLDVSGTGRFTGNVTASSGVNTPKVDFGNGFTIEPSGTELVFKYNGVIKQRMLSGGTILATGGITALSTE